MGEYSVCPNHRYSLGIRWRRSSTLCGHPDHTGKSKPESDRAVTPQISHHLLRTRGVVVPIGSGLCRNCRQIITKEMEESKWPDFEICDAPSRADHLEDATDLETIEEPVTKRPRREIVSCFDTLGLNEVSSQSEPALSQGSSWSQTSECQQQLSSGIHVLNEQIVNLSTGNTSPIKYQLQQPLECVQDSTKRYLKRKATEVILTMLHYIAPGQSSALFQWLMDDCKMSKGLENQSQDQLMTLIIRLYEEAENNTLKIQLLSLISSSNFNSKSDLQQLIPGLSKWKIDQSRDHSAHCGAGNIPANKGKVFRDRMDNEKLEHCLSFFLDPNFIQICSYGTKDIRFDNGDIITIPQVVRTACHSTLINMYKKVCSETTFTPLSDSTLFKILSTCASAKRSNLSGLDNIATDGTFAVDSLLRVTDTLRELRADTAILSTISAALKSLKLYLKSEYKFSISQSDIYGTHCIKHALSKPGNLLLQDSCDHSHENSCQKCKLLTEAKFKLNNEVQKIESPDIKEDLENSINIDFEKVTEWQAHVLRTNNQEECRLKLLDELDKHQLLIVMDWAMKCLPLLYREKQSDFFGQKGMSWHVSVAIFRAEDESLKHRTFTHLFGMVKQDWFAVASALEHTLTTIKEQMPQIQEVFLRSDNAGCYHCGCLWLSLQGISERTGIRVTRYDFSEAQSGKSICDAKIAHMRLKMRMYVSSGRNITSPFEMQAAIMDGTGVKACQCAVVEVDSSKQTMTNHRIKGINQMNNIAFDGDDIIVWQAFNVGIGIKMQRSKLLKNEQLDTGLKILSNFVGAQQIDGNITKKSKENTTGNTAEPIEQSVFYCTELGCTMQFSTYQGLQDHIDLGRHSDEKMSTYDQIRHRWVATCQANLFSSREILRRTTQETEQHHSLENDIQYGWALKKEKKFVRFSCKVKEFLQKTYQDGEVSGRKANPSDVSQHMKSLRKDNGERLFSPNEWLQPSQISSYFARLSIMPRDQSNNADIIDEDLQNIVQAIEEEEIRNLVTASVSE